jgi:hypothetical protein
MNYGNAISALTLALGRKNPLLGSFVSQALAGGYQGAQIADFLRDKLEDSGQLESYRRYASTSAPTPEEQTTRAKQEEDMFAGRATGAVIGAASSGLASIIPSLFKYKEDEKDESDEQPQLQQNQSNRSEKVERTPFKETAQNIAEAKTIKSIDDALNWVVRRAESGQPIELTAQRARVEPHLGFKKAIIKWEKQTGQDFVSYMKSVYGKRESPSPQMAQTIEKPQASAGGDQTALLAGIQQLINSL